jgi:hypothetical protein
MWFVEIPLPFAAFVPGLPRLIAGVGIVALMAGIQVRLAWVGGWGGEGGRRDTR